MSEATDEIRMDHIRLPELLVFELERLTVLPTIIWKSDHSRPHLMRLDRLVAERLLVTVHREPSLRHSPLRESLEKAVANCIQSVIE